MWPGSRLGRIGSQNCRRCSTIVMRRRQLTMRVSRSGNGPWWVCASALAGAGAAMLLPGGTTGAGAALLAVGALALLAGHTWGLMVSIQATLRAAAVAVVLVTALPALALIAVVLPQIAQQLPPEGARRARSLFV